MPGKDRRMPEPIDERVLMPGCPTEGCDGIVWAIVTGDTTHFCGKCNREVPEAQIVWYDVSQRPAVRVDV